MRNHRKTAMRMLKYRDGVSSQKSTNRLYATYPDPVDISNPEIIVEILNDDNLTTPRIEQMSANDAYRLFPSDDITREGLNIYHVRVIRRDLSNKQKYSISIDDGVTAFGCKLYGIINSKTSLAQTLIVGAKPNSLFTPPAPILNLHTVSLTIADLQREFGDDAPVNMIWNVTKGDYDIASISLTDVAEIIATGVTQSGNDVGIADLSGNKSYTLQALDVQSNNKSITRTITRSPVYYWGTYTGTILFTDADLASLSGAGVGTGKDWFSGSLNRVFSGLTANQEYFVWVFPVGKTVKFFDNAFGIEITGFLKIHDGTLNNIHGYPVELQVWRSQYRQTGTSTDIRVEVT